MVHDIRWYLYALGLHKYGSYDLSSKAKVREWYHSRSVEIRDHVYTVANSATTFVWRAGSCTLGQLFGRNRRGESRTIRSGLRYKE